MNSDFLTIAGEILLYSFPLLLLGIIQHEVSVNKYRVKKVYAYILIIYIVLWILETYIVNDLALAYLLVYSPFLFIIINILTIIMTLLFKDSSNKKKFLYPIIEEDENSLKVLFELNEISSFSDLKQELKNIYKEYDLMITIDNNEKYLMQNSSKGSYIELLLNNNEVNITIFNIPKLNQDIFNIVLSKHAINRMNHE